MSRFATVLVHIAQLENLGNVRQMPSLAPQQGMDLPMLEISTLMCWTVSGLVSSAAKDSFMWESMMCESQCPFMFDSVLACCSS